MYEYDTNADARRTIPRLREPLQTLDGEYFLVKVDPLAQTMTFSTSKGSMVNLTTLSISRVKEIIALNRAGQKAETLIGEEDNDKVEEPTYRHEEDSITRFDNKSKRSKRSKRRGQKDSNTKEGANIVEAQPKSEGGNDVKAESQNNEANSESKREPKEHKERKERGERRPRREREPRAEREPRGEQAVKAEQPSATEAPVAEERGNDANKEHRNRDNRRRGRGGRPHHHHRREGGEPQHNDNKAE
jgi:hypothetical protein